MMRMIRSGVPCVLMTVLALSVARPGLLAESRKTLGEKQLNQPAPQFELADFRGEKHSLAELKEPVVVLVFLGVECPLAQLYAPRLEQLAKEYQGQAAFLAINSNRQDSVTEMAAYARRGGLTFPYLKDTANRVADAYHAERTPEAIVLDAERRIRYRGRIDDQYGVGYTRGKPENSEMRDAVAALLEGKPAPTPLTEAVGCHIGRVATPDESSPVTYSNQIARILQKNCAECHREGEIAPFALTDYDEVVGWAETIVEVVDDRRMPPWHADSEVGHFSNARIMPEEEKELLRQWVDAGAPLGDPSQAPKPLPPKKVEWRTTRPPDAIVAMRDRPFLVPADGTVEYQYFVVDPGFKEDKWVTSCEVIPGNRRVVHHAIVFIKPPETATMRGFGWLSAYVPGQAIANMPNGVARRVPAGSKLIFQMHYTPTGAVEEDVTKVGMVFSDKSEIDHEAFTVFAVNRDISIPPFASEHSEHAVLADLPEGSRVMALAPHMHKRGKAFRVQLVQPDGSTSKLLNVPHYDFNWQHVYMLAEPIDWKPGMKLACEGVFDNSDENLVNPDPSIEVRWGDQTWQEMMLGYIEVMVPIDSVAKDPKLAELRRNAERAADRFLKLHDANGDGVVASHEAPSALSTFPFRRIDANGDKKITRDEAVKWRLRKKRPSAFGFNRR